MKKFILFIIIVIFSSTFLQAKDEYQNNIKKQAKILQQDPNNKKALKEISFLYLHKADYDQAINTGTRLADLSYAEQDYYYILYSHIALGQANMMKGNTKEAYNHLNQALASGLEQKNDSALCSIYNGLGLYASNIEKDYYRSIGFFFKGIEAAKRSKHEKLYSLLLCNISGIYYLKSDTAGFKYAQECYDLGHEKMDPFLIYIGSVNSAFMCYLKKDYEQATRFLQEGEFLMIQNDFYDQTNVYSLFGYIYAAMNDDESAITYFKKALSIKEKGQTSSIMHAYLGYAGVLMNQGRHIQAIPLLKNGVELSYTANNAIYRSDLLKKLAESYKLSGQLNEALKYYQLFQTENDSLFNVDKERDLSDLRVKYDIAQQESELRKGKLTILEKEKRMQLLFAVLVFFIMVAVLLYYLFIRKNILYRAIVRQNLEAIRREDLLKKQLEVSSEASQLLAQEKYSASSLTSEKSQSLFYKIEQLMRTDKVYSENLLTKEKVAEVLGTNRTYLSQVINEQTGHGFTQYINTFRIEEAIRILSDPQNNNPLKAISSDLGFNSMTTFYSLFHKAVGMTPAQYRNKVQQLTKG